jgi:hypothetical protein
VIGGLADRVSASPTSIPETIERCLRVKAGGLGPQGGGGCSAMGLG